MKILFITHDTSRTGAPILLLLFLKWLKSYKPEVKIDVLSLKSGSMDEEFIEYSDQFINLNVAIKNKPLNYLQRILKRLNLLQPPKQNLKFYNKLAKNNYDVIYANTIISIPIARQLIERSKNSRFIAHIHELNTVIKQYVKEPVEYFSGIDTFIVPSRLVAQNLITQWHIPSNIINIVYGFSTLQHKNDNSFISSGKFTVGASGAVHWRKGYDVFIQLARHVVKYYEREIIDFVWVGYIDAKTKLIIEEDLRKLGLTEKITFTGEVEYPSIHFNNFDVFVMTSREDPFPLVCIEVGQLSKPIISFDQATGTNEILSYTGGGFIVPYLDVEAMAEKVMLYYHDPNLKETHGAINKEEFSKFTPAVICPQIFSIIEEQL